MMVCQDFFMEGYASYRRGISLFFLVILFCCSSSFAKEEVAINGENVIQLPEGSAPDPEAMPHFPDRLHAFVWRNWNLVEIEKLADILQTETSNIAKMANNMGLPSYKKPSWKVDQIYITLIRRNWHLLPYEQLLALVEMTPERLNFALREDDFLWIKLGMLKPKCTPLYYQEPNEEAKQWAKEVKKQIKKSSKIKEKEPRFAFIDDLKRVEKGKERDQKEIKSISKESSSLRFIYSYFALYGDPLSDDEAEIFPEGLLDKLSDLGVNGLWLHVLLRDMAPGGDAFPEFGEGHEKRLRNLRRTVEKAKEYGIDIYLYLNEPRSLPTSFFNNKAVPGREETKGVSEGDYHAMCTSNADVRNWLRNSIAHVFENVPGLGGVFTISGSENLTYCNSHGGWQQCDRCKEKSGAEIIADANALIAEGVHRVNPQAKVILWDWGWNGHGMAEDVIEKLPDNIWLMSVSEWALPIERGGVRVNVGEYSISAVGPGPRAKEHWRVAKERGLNAVAKVQFNCTWEIAAVPYVPVMDLVAEHCSNLSECAVDGYLLSWTLGGYPSPNLEIPQLFDKTPVPSKEQVLDELAWERYGEKGAPFARKAWTLMSEAYREYPYSGSSVYSAPVQIGPANLFRSKATGYAATMVGIPYDDLNAWRSVYPPEVFAQQFEKVSAGFKEGIKQLKQAVSLAKKDRKKDVEAELRYANVVRIHFESVANQIRYILLRDEYNQPDTSAAKREVLSEKMRVLIEKEITLTEELYPLIMEDSRIGFESTNHYFYMSNDLLEKLISCRQILSELNK